jgi:hypothetical protein
LDRVIIHQYILQARINRYLAFIESSEIDDDCRVPAITS